MPHGFMVHAPIILLNTCTDKQECTLENIPRNMFYTFGQQENPLD